LESAAEVAPWDGVFVVDEVGWMGRGCVGWEVVVEGVLVCWEAEEVAEVE